MKSVFLIFCIVFGYANSTNPSYHALILGGYGATNFIELVTKDGICKAADVDPPLPVIPASNPTWVAEYVDGKIYLCGGQVNNIMLL